MDVDATADQPWVILVTGHPGTGKTTLGKLLAQRYGMPLITKDAFKERIFDILGYSDKTWSLKVSAASHRIIDYLVEQELAAGRSLILESNFKPEIDDQRFRRIRDSYSSAWIQVLCWARGDVLFDRYTARQHGSERHPGHTESATTEQTRTAIGTGRADLLRMPDVTLELDTTDLATIDYSTLFSHLDEYRTKTTRDRIVYGEAASEPGSLGTMAAVNSQSVPTAYSGVLLGESLRLDAVFDANGLRVKRLWRTAAGDPEAGQPSVWTFIEFEVESDATAAAASLKDVLDETGGWYCSFGSVDEMVVVFSGRVFRYPRGDTSGRQEVEAYAQSVGVPDAQLDWEDWK